MRAITVQDFNPALRIFVEAPTQEMRQRLVKVRNHFAHVGALSQMKPGKQSSKRFLPHRENSLSLHVKQRRHLGLRRYKYQHQIGRQQL